jgi:hypothetical protein
MDKENIIHTMEYYLTIRKNEIMSFAGKWMELEIIMLIKIRQSPKPSITCFHSFVESRPKVMIMMIMITITTTKMTIRKITVGN